MTLLEFEKILKQGELIHTEFKSWIKVSNMRERIALVVDDFGEITSLTVPYDLVVSGSNHYVYLVTDEEVGVLKKLYKFDKNNIRMWC